jgi:arylsulfatase A-like enzyme
MYEQVVNVPLIIRDSRHPELGGKETRDLVSLMDLGPTLLEAAGLEVPTYLEGRSLRPYIEDKHENFHPREWVYCEDNYEIMMRGERYKMVYYIGQEEGELYDLEVDPHEFENLWTSTAHASLREGMLRKLLEWIATSAYYNAGYKRGRSRQYRMCWPSSEDPYLTGARAVDRPVDL